MKLMIALFSMLVMSSSFASTSDTETFNYDGSQDEVELLLRTEETHTEYRYEQRRSTCYRNETHYRTICHSTPEGRRCYTQPYHRTVSYSCIETVRIGYEVKDYDVEAKVNLSVAKIAAELSNTAFKVKLHGDNLSISAQGSKLYFVLLNKSQIRSNIQGGVKYIDATYAASFVEAAPVLNALSLSNLFVKGTDLTFKTGVIASREQIGFSLDVTKAPILGSDTEMFDRELASSEIGLNTLENSSAVSISLQKLGVSLNGGRFKLTPSIFYKHKDKVLNADQFKALEVSQTLLFKN